MNDVFGYILNGGGLNSILIFENEIQLNILVSTVRRRDDEK